MSILLGFGVCVCTFLNRYLFSLVGENLTYTLRKLLFEGIIYKHMAWFDSKDKAPGVLTNVLSEDIILLNGLTTETLSIYAEAICAMIIGIILAFYFSWTMSLITLGALPFFIIGIISTYKLSSFGKGISNSSKDKVE